MICALSKGTLPLLVSMPHVGTTIPDNLKPLYVERALQVEDTDWHLERLYAFVQAMGASTLVPRYSRYVIDLNRPPDNMPMYPGASNTELCPTKFFTGEELYKPGIVNDDKEVEQRKAQYWEPYHQALRSELQRLKQLHGYALLWDAHSIRGEIPWLFDGKLPDLNIGTANDNAAHPSIAEAVRLAAENSGSFSSVVNGRFKGGYITRHYGDPLHAIHAVQLEKCQHLYMSEEFPFAYNDSRASALQPVLESMINAALLATKKLHSSAI